MGNKFNKLILTTILALALFLRLYKLDQYPVGFLWDEAALGYNAYSILKTGRDEFGKFLPIIFKSFGDYKPGLYVYLTIPSILLFGLNEFAVRLPSAIAGTVAVLAVYLLIIESTKLGTDKKKTKDSSLALIAALILTVSPWHLHFSRGAWELNLMLTELLLGILFLIKFLTSEKKRYLFLSVLSLLSSLVTYQAAKFLLPALLIGFAYFYRKNIYLVPKEIKTRFVFSCLMGFVIINLVTVIGGKAGRIKTMSVFSYPRSEEEKTMVLSQDNQNKSIYRVFHEKPIFFLRSVLGRYFNHFSGKFLFIAGDWSNSRNGVVYQGVLYYLEAALLVIGFSILVGKKRGPLENLMIFWLLVAPLPSALTRDSISSVRSFTMVIPLVFIIAVGIQGLVDYFRKYSFIIQSSLFIILLASYFFFFVRFLDLYFIHDPKFNSRDRLYGYRETIGYLEPLVSQKSQVIFTDLYGQPYIFWLFYTKYDPAKYQKINSFKENPFGDVGEVERIDNIEFRKIYFPADRSISGALLIDNEFGLPTKDINSDEERFNLVKQVNFLDGQTAFRIVAVK